MSRSAGEVVHLDGALRLKFLRAEERQFGVSASGSEKTGDGRVLAGGHRADGRQDVGHVRREPTDRMWRIHEYLAANEYPNCSGLAREFEVSHKTVARDVEYMRDHFGLPIEYDSHKRGFF